MTTRDVWRTAPRPRSRRRLLRDALVGAGALLLPSFVPTPAGAEESAMCPTCGVAPFGPLHAYLYRVSPDPHWSDAIAGRESSWRADATNPSSGAAGLFQFLPWVWYDWLVPEGLAYGSPYDPYAAIDAHAACLREGYAWMWACTVESGCAG